MMRRSVLGGLAGALALMLPGCGMFGSSLPTYRYRLTVEVDTPEGLRTGSSVIEVYSRDDTGPFTLPEASKLQLSFRGEAVAVDLPGGQTLFALLRGQGTMPGGTPTDIGAEGYAPIALARDEVFAGPQAYASQLDWMMAHRNVAIMPTDSLPLLVWFRDIHDPKTLQRVDPGDLAASFGKDVKLRRITVQMTDDLVTTGIDKRLGWLDHLEKYRTYPNNPFTSTLASEVIGLRSQ